MKNLRTTILPATSLALMFAIVSFGGMNNLPFPPLPEQIDNQLAALGSLVIREDVDRYAGAGGRGRRIDTFETVVEVVDGIEHYSGITHNGRPFSATQISGTWSFGELATLLRTTREALVLPGTQIAYGRADFYLPASSRRWFVSIDSRVYWLGISGEAILSAETGEISSIRWTSSELPAATGVDHIEWTVDFGPTEVGGRSWNLPEKSEYRVIHTGGNGSIPRSEWNVTHFVPLGRYGSESAISFEH
jgi:hypothetical protein